MKLFGAKHGRKRPEVRFAVARLFTLLSLSYGKDRGLQAIDVNY